MNLNFEKLNNGNIRITAESAAPTVDREMWDAMLSAMKAREIAEDKHMNCPDCNGEGEPEMCETCFPYADDARLKMRYALDVCKGANPIGASNWELLSALKAAESILWMAEKYAEGGGSNSMEMESFSPAAAEIAAVIVKAEAPYHAARNAEGRA